MDAIFACIGQSAKYVFVAACCVYVICSERWEPFFLLAGGIFNAVLSKVIKNAVRLPRPDRSPKSGYGMPSSHAQSMSYFLCALLFKQHLLFSSRWADTAFLIGMAMYVALAR